MNWIQLGGSIVAILVLAGVALALKLGGGAAIADEQAAVDIAETELSGFAADSAWLAVDRRHAVVIGRDGSVALIRPHGAHYVVRRTIAPAYRQIDEHEVGGRIEIDSGERLWGTLPMTMRSRWQAGGLAQALAAARSNAGNFIDINVSKRS